MLSYAEFLESKRRTRLRSVYIYVLVDPFTDEVRYVGKSIRPRERLANHCNEQSVTWRTNWIRTVLAQGKRPLLRIVQILDRDEDWRAAERDWIAGLKERGARLTNCTSGGDGVSGLPPEIRARMALTWTGRKHRPESLLKIGAASRGRVHSPESRENMRRQMAGRKHTWVDKVSRTLSKLTDEQVRQIRDGIARKVSQYALAEQFGVHQGTISNIKHRRSYGWVE
jgi:hypothetical protein